MLPIMAESTLAVKLRFNRDQSSYGGAAYAVYSYDSVQVDSDEFRVARSARREGHAMRVASTHHN